MERIKTLGLLMMLKSNAADIRNWLRLSERCVLVADRGFGYVTELLKDCGIKTGEI